MVSIDHYPVLSIRSSSHIFSFLLNFLNSALSTLCVMYFYCDIATIFGIFLTNFPVFYIKILSGHPSKSIIFMYFEETSIPFLQKPDSLHIPEFVICVTSTDFQVLSMSIKYHLDIQQLESF